MSVLENVYINLCAEKIQAQVDWASRKNGHIKATLANGKVIWVLPENVM